MTNEDETVYVFDTSAWLALIEDEPGAEMVQDVLEGTASGKIEVFVSFMSYIEVFYITLQEREIEEAQIRLRIMDSLPITRVESTVSMAMNAARLKAKHRVSVVDAWISG